jgi:hypothetical protein
VADLRHVSSKPEHKAMTDSVRFSMALVADHLAAQREIIAQRWLQAVKADADIEATDQLTHVQLLDHLPSVFRDLCQFLRWRDAAALAGETREDAQEHGLHRWEQGYQLDALLRELDVLRRIVLSEVGTLTRNAQAAADEAARTLVEEFFSFVTRTSVKQFVEEQQARDTDYQHRLEDANRQLQAGNGRLADLAASRALLPLAAAEALREIVEPLSRGMTGESAALSGLVRRHMAELDAFAARLRQYAAVLSEERKVVAKKMTLRPLFDELLQDFTAMASTKGLAVEGRFDVPLGEVVSDPDLLRQIAASLMRYALGRTARGRVTFSFSRAGDGRWRIEASYAGTALAAEVTDDRSIAPEPHKAGLDIDMAKAFASLLGGTVRAISTGTRGVLCEATLPLSGTPLSPVGGIKRGDGEA